MNQVESILQITTALRNDHLNPYQSQHPYYNKMCLLTHSKITWPTNSVLKGNYMGSWLVLTLLDSLVLQAAKNNNFKTGKRVGKKEFPLTS